MYNILYKKGFYNMFDYINLINDKLNDKNNKIINNLYDNMSSYQKEIFNKLKTDKDFSCEYSLNDLVFDFDSKVIETLLNIELDVYLDFCSKNNIFLSKIESIIFVTFISISSELLMFSLIFV